MPTKTKAPASPLTGLYLVRNSGGCYLKRGTFGECTDYAEKYSKDRRSRGLPVDACEVIPERLFVQCRELKDLLPDVTIPISQFAVEAVQARATGNRVEAWWGGMDGGPAMFEEWEATLGDKVPELKGVRVRCYRGGTSELDRPPAGHWLTALEILPHASNIFSVKDGKFHRAAEPVTNETAFRPTKTACGIVVVPLNHFVTVADAADYTGNRLHLFGCKKCGLDKPQ